MLRRSLSHKCSMGQAMEQIRMGSVMGRSAVQQCFDRHAAMGLRHYTDESGITGYAAIRAYRDAFRCAAIAGGDDPANAARRGGR
jgi:hypothetical protein